MLLFGMKTNASGVGNGNSNSSVDANVGNIIMGFTRTVGGICTACIIFRVKRRLMAITSGLGIGISCVLLGLLVHSTKQPTVFPLMCFVTYILFGTFGHYTLPILIMYELYPLQVRGILGGITSSSLNFFISGANWCYPYVRDKIGFANTIISFGLWSFAGCVFLYICLPETKGLTLQQTEAYYKDRK